MRRRILPGLLVCTILALRCAPSSHIRQLRGEAVTAQLRLPEERDIPIVDTHLSDRNDTLVVEDPEGNQVYLMKAVRDIDGEMVATDRLEAARVTARFRNVAERRGKVDLRFQIQVPARLQDSDWQLRFYPRLLVLDDSLNLEPVLITGQRYRRAQLKGYEQYRRFLASISADSLHFVDQFQLENFLERNLPQVYRFRSDSSLVTDEDFASAFGITEQQALEHYTNQLRVRLNRRKVLRKERVFHRLVPSPIVTEGLRLDTVMQDVRGDFVYEYVHTLAVRPGLRKASVMLEGDILQEGERIYAMPDSEPLTFYISSLSSLTDDAVRYKTQIVSRKVEAHTACYIHFGQGEAVIRETDGNNAEEMARIRENIASLLENRTFDMDSIVVTASCSPEGDWAANQRLSHERSRAVSDYLAAFIRSVRDTLPIGEQIPDIRFLPRQNAENWAMLDALVREDLSLEAAHKEAYARLRDIPDPDRREAQLQGMPAYRYIREALYPRLRTVKFDFHLHRKDLQKDTIHTTVVDTAYMDGVQAIRDRDYQRAVTLLRPYKDYNTAVAYCALDYNASALDIAERLEPSDRVLYLEALLYSRGGNEKKAVACYLQACRLNPAFIHRGNLDPEISQLIKKYDINTQNL